MMRVAFTLAGGPNQWTGGFNYLRNAFRILRRYQRDRIRPILFVGPELATDDVQAMSAELDEAVVRAPWLGGAARRSRTLKSLVTGCDRVALCQFRAHSVDVAFEAGEYFGALFPIPTVAWVADFQSHHLPQMFSRRARWRTYLGRNLQLLGRRVVLLSSEDARRDCRRFYPRSAGREVVAPFAVLPASAALPEPRLLERYALPERFLFLPNQFWKHKNHAVVIDALPIARRVRPNLVVAASGNPIDHRHPGHMTALESRIDRLGVRDAFRILGMIPSSDVMGLVELSVAVVNPSLFEGWSTTVEEAKSLGVPLVLSSIAVHREQAGETARYFDPHSASSAADALVAAWDARVSAPLVRREEAGPGVVQRTARFAEDLVRAFEAARAR